MYVYSDHPSLTLMLLSQTFFSFSIYSTITNTTVCFKAYDVDNSGFISKEELLLMLKGVYGRVYFYAPEREDNNDNDNDNDNDSQNDNNNNRENPNYSRSPSMNNGTILVGNTGQTLEEFVDKCFVNLDYDR